MSQSLHSPLKGCLFLRFLSKLTALKVKKGCTYVYPLLVDTGNLKADICVLSLTSEMSLNVFTLLLEKDFSPIEFFLRMKRISEGSHL